MAWLHMDLIDYTTEIDAPVGEVFAHFKKVRDWPAWASGIKSSAMNGEWCVGARLTFVPHFFPLPLRPFVYGYEENRAIEWGVRTKVATMIHSFTFNATGERRCSVRHLEFAEGLMTPFSLPAKGRIRQFDKLWADDLKRHMESTRPTPGAPNE